MASRRTRTRRELLGALAAGAGALAGCSAPSPGEESSTDTATPTSDGSAGDGADWPTFRGDNRNTGYAPEEGGPVDYPEQAWSTETEGGVWSSPTVVDGRVYIGSMDGTLYGLDAETGDADWTYETGGPVQSTPAVADGRVYVGSFDKHVHCVDAETGDREWATETAGIVHSSPAVSDGTVYVGAGTLPFQEVRAFLEESGIEQSGGGVYALDADTGERRWRRFPTRYLSSSPAVVDSSVYIGLTDGEPNRPLVVSLATEDGSTEWEYETESAVLASPSVWEGSVYAAGYDGFVYAVTADGGEKEWTFDVGTGEIRGSTAVSEHGLYVPVSGNEFAQTSNNPVLFSLTFDGEKRWTHEIPGARQMGSSPVATSDAVYVGTHHSEGDGGIYAVSHFSDRLWGIEVIGGEGVGTSPTVVDGTVYYGADDTTVYAVE